MRTHRAGRLAAGAVVAIIALLAAVLLLTSRSNPDKTAATATTSGATATTAAADTTGSPAASTVATASTGRTQTTTGAGTLATVSSAGAFMTAPPEPFNVDGAADLPCTAFVANGHVTRPSRCGRAHLAPTGRLAIWVTGRTPDTGAWTIRIFAYDDNGSWSERLRAVEEVPGQTWTGVDVVPATLSSGGTTLLAMATNQGSGVYFGYDLVRWPSSTGRPTVVAHRGDLAHGSYRVRQTSDGTVLDDYGANYDDGAPNCCPNRYDHARIVFRGGLFRYLARERIPASAVQR